MLNQVLEKIADKGEIHVSVSDRARVAEAPHDAFDPGLKKQKYTRPAVQGDLPAAANVVSEVLIVSTRLQHAGVECTCF